MTAKENTLVFWLAAALLLFSTLSGADLWTQEWRWADILWYMHVSGDYFHPHLAGSPYYDKPLLSYWFMLLSTKFFGLNEWGLRLPSACAGLVVLYCTRSIGKIIFNPHIANKASWILLTSYFFIFWSRIASSDMLNVASILLAVNLYFIKKNKTDFFSYFIFCFVLATSALIKGPVAIILVGLVVLPDLIASKKLTTHLNFKFLLSVFINLFIYTLPFLIAHQNTLHENSLYLVYRENVLRFLSPFDHQSHWTTYFIYLPYYLLPWSLISIPCFFKKPTPLSKQQKTFLISTVFIFLFFTVSGSRRSYYILPLLPFTALWIAFFLETHYLKKIFYHFIIPFYLVLLLWFSCFQNLYFHYYGIKPFVRLIKTTAIKLKPWDEWQLISIGADDRISFYLQPRALPSSFRDFPQNTAALESFKKTRPLILIISSSLFSKYHALLPTPRFTLDSASQKTSVNKQDKDIALIIP